MPNNTVVVGAGISGLLSALILARKNEGQSIFVVEKAAEIGGLLRKFDYGEFGVFDYGMHNMLETGIPELDKIVFDLLPEEEWQILTGKDRDLAGLYFNGKLQTNTPYIDLRNLAKADYQACLADFFAALNKRGQTSIDTDCNALDFVLGRFGKGIAERAILPALGKIYKKPGEALDYMATTLTPLDRVAFCDEVLSEEFAKSELLRSHIAFSDQRNLPLERSTGRKGYYPKKYGIHRVVDGLRAQLLEYQVSFLLESEVSALEYGANRIAALEIKRGEERQTITDIDRLVWTGPMPVLGRLLQVDFDGLKYDKPLKTVICNILVDKELDMGDLYYFFCYDDRFNTYRLSNYQNYCAGAKRNGGYPICLELVMEEEEITSEKQLTDLALEELQAFKLMPPGAKVLFAKAEVLASGFPMPSVNNVTALNSIREQIQALDLDNLSMLGVLAEKNLFFQTDVIRDAYTKVG